ncbi:hypothetical protein [Paenibacillus sp. 203]|uniref:hypothetical protein n=1 Tax=Paenibacillus sp. 203 TaxID=3096765 RepID=UPI00300A670D
MLLWSMVSLFFICHLNLKMIFIPILALPHRNDTDGGYLAFIKAVNRVLGQEVYS